MDENAQPNPPEEEGGPTPVGDKGQFTQRIRHQQISARVPEPAAKGVFSSGSLVLNGAHEFVIDFLQTVTRPHQVAVRVILPPTILGNLTRAIRQNLENFEKRFGQIPEPPKPPSGLKPPSIDEIYEQLKIPDEIAAGVYANTAMITHSARDFCFDFIAGFYPRATVAARVYMSAPQVPRLLDTLSRSMDQYQQRIDQLRRQQQQQRPPEEPPNQTST